MLKVYFTNKKKKTCYKNLFLKVITRVCMCMCVLPFVGPIFPQNASKRKLPGNFLAFIRLFSIVHLLWGKNVALNEAVSEVFPACDVPPRPLYQTQVITSDINHSLLHPLCTVHATSLTIYHHTPLILHCRRMILYHFSDL